MSNVTAALLCPRVDVDCCTNASEQSPLSGHVANIEVCLVANTYLITRSILPSGPLLVSRQYVPQTVYNMHIMYCRAHTSKFVSCFPHDSLSNKYHHWLETCTVPDFIATAHRDTSFVVEQAYFSTHATLNTVSHLS